jgi:hypothetical protein
VLMARALLMEVVFCSCNMKQRKIKEQYKYSQDPHLCTSLI